MALILTLREGEDFYVRENRYLVQEIVADMEFKLLDKQSGKVHTITDAHAVEIESDVFISAGDLPPSATVRVVVGAPRSILVIRGEKKRNPPQHIREKA